MKIYNFAQGSPEWHAIRRRKLTASHGTAIGNHGTGLVTYVDEIVLALCIEPDEYYNSDMARGNELEPTGRLVYEFERGIETRQVGFIEYNEFVGCSPDSLVGDDGGLELKARNDRIHFKLLKDGKVDSGTVWQMNMCMLVTGRKWWDFGSYNPKFNQSLFVKRFYPEPKKIEGLLIGFEMGEKMIKELLGNENIKKELRF